jgi:DNA (cytosine-5)-methyltransferase 1
LWYSKRRRAQNDQDFETWIRGGVCPTLNAFDNTGDSRATVLIIDGTRVNDVRIYEEPVQTLKERMGTGGNNVPIIAIPILMRGREGKPGGGKGPLLSENISLTLAGGNDQVLFEPVIAFDGYNQSVTEDIYRALRIGIDSGDHIQIPTDQEDTMQVRRLTPVECERLMGWPDNHTLPRADGKQNADTTRYKMCGNGVASPVAQWIGQHLMAIMNDE